MTRAYIKKREEECYVPWAINVPPIDEYLIPLGNQNTDWYNPNTGVGRLAEFLSLAIVFTWLSACYAQQRVDIIEKDRYVPSQTNWMGAVFLWGSPGIGKSFLSRTVANVFVVKEFYPDGIWEEISSYINEVILTYTEISLHGDDEKRTVKQIMSKFPPRPDFLDDEAFMAWLVKEVLKKAVLYGLNGNLLDTIERQGTVFQTGIEWKSEHARAYIHNPMQIIIDPSVREPVDIRGAVVTDKIYIPGRGFVRYTETAIPFEFFSTLLFPMGVLVIEDFPLADEPVIKALRMILHEGMLHAVDKTGKQMVFPSGWRIVCNGNYPGQTRTASDIPELVRNRMVHFTFDIPPGCEIQDFEIKSDSSGRTVIDERLYDTLHPFVSAFIARNKHFLSEDIANRMAGPTVRTITYVSAMLRAFQEIVSTVKLTDTQRAVLESVLGACITGAMGFAATDAMLKEYKAFVFSKVPQPISILSLGARAITEDFIQKLENEKHHNMAFSYAVSSWARAMREKLSGLAFRFSAAGMDENDLRNYLIQVAGQQADTDRTVTFQSKDSNRSITFESSDFEGLMNAMEFIVKLTETKISIGRRMFSDGNVKLLSPSDLVSAELNRIRSSVPATPLLLAIGAKIQPRLVDLIGELDRLLSIRLLDESNFQARKEIKK